MAKPPNGTFTVKQRKDGTYLLTGTRLDGTTHRVKVSSLTEGHTLGQSMFKGVQHRALPQAPNTGVVTSPAGSPQVDDFGLPTGFTFPQVSAETVASNPHPATPAPIPGIDQTIAAQAAAEATKLDRTKRAKGMAEMIAIGAVSAEVMVTRKALEARFEEVPKVNQKQTNAFADELREGLASTFGDREVGPWTMALLYAIGIPLGMWLQSSKPKPKELEPGTKAAGPNLSSVP